MVPRCSNKTVNYGVYGIRIAFDLTKSPHYKLIHAVRVYDAMYRLYIQIESYSSETDMWNVCSVLYREDSFLGFRDGIYWNDAIYWHNKVYNQDPRLIKLDIINVEHQTLTTIETPRILDGKVTDFQLFESFGRLLLLCRKDGNPLLMDVYKMKKGYSEWLVKYRMNLNEDVSCPRRLWKDPLVYSIVLGEREEDSYMVIRDSEKIGQYKPKLKTSHDFVYHLESAQNVKYHCFQFIASFSGVGL